VIRFWQTYRENREGGLIVEAALLLPLLITAGLGGLDASNMLLQNHKMEGQLTIASAYLSKSNDPAQRETSAKQLAVTGNVSGSGGAIIPGWSTNDVTISYATIDNSGELYRGGATIQTVRISSTLNYKGFGVLSSILPNGIKLKSSVEERIVGGGL